MAEIHFAQIYKLLLNSFVLPARSSQNMQDDYYKMHKLSNLFLRRSISSNYFYSSEIFAITIGFPPVDQKPAI